MQQQRDAFRWLEEAASETLSQRERRLEYLREYMRHSRASKAAELKQQQQQQQQQQAPAMQGPPLPQDPMHRQPSLRQQTHMVQLQTLLQLMQHPVVSPDALQIQQLNQQAAVFDPHIGQDIGMALWPMTFS
ncbi:hypothetical protein HK105_202350 [Polyrhizophydium stewartii]|uniref:Uncharacterized protein n=1 Tax=Polyrhizophydium stewartii TaxID=2732419 RepID=A0ABR4NEI5_9FUNG